MRTDPMGSLPFCRTTDRCVFPHNAVGIGGGESPRT